MTRPVRTIDGEAAPDDGFGAAIRDLYDLGPAPGRVLQVIEREDGCVSLEDMYRYYTSPDEWPAAERRAVALARGRVLDIGCAAGRHMLAMDGDREVIGIDPSAGAVAVAQAQGLDARLGTVLDPGDIGRFDTIALLGGNLGLLGSREEAPAVLYSLARLARPGAQLLAIGHDPTRNPLPEHRAYHQTNRKRGRLPGQVRMRVRYRTWKSAWFNRLLVTPDDLAVLLEGSAWTLGEVTYSGPVGFYLAEMAYTETPSHTEVPPAGDRAC
ncbi:methyltransferase domain-containing protein [Actinomadura hibisca]|uniref:methyltransferase domain-containing protein n=1 Tax=Actinomadura hibisca TaxID=68565 RepID=UPI000A0586A9|nr:methyltransferase domain-containing protein [Actinomadura hibisca]